MQLLRTIACAVIVTTLAGYGLMPADARAQQSGSTVVAPAGTRLPEVSSSATVWNVNIGAGMALRPTYEGSNRYRVSPVPYVNITYDDMISLSAGGLSAYWHHDGLRIGGGLTVEGGRKDHRTNEPFSEGDDRLRGLGDIDAAAGVGVFVSDELGFMVLRGSVTKLTHGVDNGVFAKFGVSIAYRISGRLMMSPHMTVTWANRNYMQAYFGVTPAQAADSEFPEFNANSGFDDATAGISAVYSFPGRWSVIADATMDKLTGDASKSPITFSHDNAHFAVIAAYHF